MDREHNNYNGPPATVHRAPSCNPICVLYFFTSISRRGVSSGATGAWKRGLQNKLVQVRKLICVHLSAFTEKSIFNR